MVKTVNIGGSEIGPGQPCFIIAEAGVNHNGDPALARELVLKAKAAGANCVKFQTFAAERVVTRAAPKAKYQLQVTDPAESQFAMLKKLELSVDAHRDLLALCKKEGIVFMSTPYSVEDARMLAEIGVPGFKIASGQIIETPFLEEIARMGLPIILSTGMATLAEVDEAVRCILATGNDKLVLLQCTTNYPSAADDANLRVMDTLSQAFGLPVGYSDHTEGITVCFGAVGRGATVIEKHFTLDRKMPGPDHSSSAEPADLEALVRGVRDVEAALGSPVKRPTARESGNIAGMRRSIVAAGEIPAGTVLTREMFRFKRPATGIAPARLGELVGRKARRTIAPDAMLSWADVE